ncbi:MAG TPA: DnaB-like helicase C-terminal domain-containing protein, partial [Phycisphaerae bacterium]|nr:DnaB-like helicase C-terminal domain-containing protein [Phycisphaerae bacterium]
MAKAFSDIHRYARRYLEMGFHPFACTPRDKFPWGSEEQTDGSRKGGLSWKAFQTSPPALSLVDSWWERGPDANVAIILPPGLVVVDLDGDGAEDLLRAAGVELPADAPRVRTGNGEHVYFHAEGLPQRVPLLAAESGKPAVDFKSNGGYVVAPPSIHQNGKKYEWIVAPSFPLPELPEAMRTLVLAKRQEQSPPKTRPDDGAHWVIQAMRGVGHGERDNIATRLAGYFLGCGVARDIVMQLLGDFAEKCSPPLPLPDVVRIIRSIASAEASKPAPEQARGTDGDDCVPVQHISDALVDAVVQIEKGPQRMVGTPYPLVNKILVGGFSPGELVYLGARPGMGKTAIALEIARGAAKAGHNVLIVSREMVNSHLARRMLAQEGRINASELKLGTMTDRALLDRTAEKLSCLPIWLTDAASSVAELLAVFRVLERADARPTLVIVDYLQLIRAPAEIRERRMQVDFVSGALKSKVAMANKVTVLCLSSLSRPQEGKDKRPTMASLRESGQLEHDADTVMFL